MSVQFGYAILYVPSVPAALRFYEAAFGFEGSFLHESGDYGELRTGATRLAFVSHAQAAQAVPFAYQPVERASPRFGVSFTFTTRDVDALWKRALAAGATPPRRAPRHVLGPARRARRRLPRLRPRAGNPHRVRRGARQAERPRSVGCRCHHLGS